MGRHRVPRRWGRLLAVPLALLTPPTALLAWSLHASAAQTPAVSGSATCSGDQWVASYRVSADAGGTWVSAVANDGTVTGFTQGGAIDGSVTVTVTLPAGYSGSSTSLTVTAEYAGDPDPVTFSGNGEVGLSGSCPVPPPQPPAPPPQAPTTTSGGTTAPRPPVTVRSVPTTTTTTTTATMAVATAMASTTPSASAPTTQVQPAPVAAQSRMPSAMTLGSTAGILVAFAVSLVFLVKERRKLADLRDEDELEHWRDYR